MRAYRVLLFVLAVLILLGVVSFVLGGATYGEGWYAVRIPSFTGASGEETSKAVSADSIVASVEEVIESSKVQETQTGDFFTSSVTRFYMPDGNVNYFKPLFEALQNARNEAVHIMHYGDSQIEGDRITGYLRKRFQEQYGGSGVGLLPLLQPIQSTAVKQTLTAKLPAYYGGGIMGKRCTEHNRYGAMGQFAELRESDSTVTMQLTANRFRDFQYVRIFVADAEGLEVAVGNKVQRPKDGKGLEQINFSLKKPLGKLAVSFKGKADVLGICVDSLAGVSVSNIPMRGSDGTFLSRIDSEYFRAMHAALNTRLVILEFGGNALPYLKDSLQVEKFCKGFSKQINYVKKNVPNAQILVIGPADMCVKRAGRLQTHPMLPMLVRRLQQSSNAAGAAYWDMFNVMGGENSMMAWVDHSPKWAASDYIHFTRKGAERISELLINTFDVYQQLAQ